MAEKRALPAKVAAMKARKRQRVADLHDQNAAKKAEASAPRRRIDADSLSWRSTSLPDRMEDSYGFFGLEEIDDVEVRKDDATGTVSFHSRERTAPDQPVKESNHDDADSWEGFSDDGGSQPVSQRTVTKPNAIERRTSTVKVARSVVTDNEHSVNTAFSILEKAEEHEDVDVSEWKPLKLLPDVLAALTSLRFAKPTPIQRTAIPEILKGHDVIGKASTGSGKTLAFGIPILERHLERLTDNRKTKGPLALILSPTRELAHQLSNHLGSLFEGVGSRTPQIATLTGGLSMQKQQRLLKDADVIIGTPGRLWEIISEGQGVAAALKKIEFLVVDEADRLLSEGHFKEVEEILNTLDRYEDADQDSGVPAVTTDLLRQTSENKRQTLVFSATFDRGLQKKLIGKTNRKDNLLSNKESMEYLLSKLNFREETPKFVDVNPVRQLASGLREGLIECSGVEKDLYLYALLLMYSAKRTMVFTNSISAVRRVAPLLQNLNLNAMALHSGMPQKARLRSVERFGQGKDNGKGGPVVLVATDVAARGLDIPNVDLVVHYHLPRAADTYVHRSGRTARAGQQGASVLICGPEEVAGVRRLVAKVHAQSAAAADNENSTATKQGFFIRTMDIDRRVVSRLKERLTLAKKLADATIAKEKQHKEDDFMRAAAEELGVDYDSEEFEKQAPGRHGRGSGRKKKEREARQLTKADIGATKAELKHLLGQRVNVGVSEKYLTSGRVDVDELLRQRDSGKSGDFLGTVGQLGLEDL